MQKHIPVHPNWQSDCSVTTVRRYSTTEVTYGDRSSSQETTPVWPYCQKGFTDQSGILPTPGRNYTSELMSEDDKSTYSDIFLPILGVNNSSMTTVRRSLPMIVLLVIYIHHAVEKSWLCQNAIICIIIEVPFVITKYYNYWRWSYCSVSFVNFVESNAIIIIIIIVSLSVK